MIRPTLIPAIVALGLAAGPVVAQGAPAPSADAVPLDETLTPPTDLDATNFVFLLPGVILALTAVVGAALGAGSTPNTVAED